MTSYCAGIYIPPEEKEEKSCPTCKYLYESMCGTHCSKCSINDPKNKLIMYEPKKGG